MCKMFYFDFKHEFTNNLLFGFVCIYLKFNLDDQIVDKQTIN